MEAKEQTKNRLAIAGQVSNNETQLPISGVLVEIDQMQGEFKNWLNLHALQYGKSWGKMLKRPDRTLTTINGCFYFINLPDGDYNLSLYRANAVISNGTKQDERLLTDPFNIEIALRGINEYIWQPIVLRTIKFTISGEIIDENKDSRKVANARVQIKGRLASVLSNMEGKYHLNIEQNAFKSPTVEVYASGYKPFSENVNFSEEEVKDGKLNKNANLKLIQQAEQSS